jgi:hypothetical protein
LARLLKTEIQCHNCGKYVSFNLDVSLNGNHVLNCPECGHEHCRVVKDGQVTGDRWSSRNATYNVITYSQITYSVSSTIASTGSNLAYWHTYTSSSTAAYYGTLTA